jgi:hypothetical protein
MIPQGQEVALRAVGTALAGLAVAFAGYMLAYGGGRIRVTGMEHLAIFAQPRGTATAEMRPVLPPLAEPKRPLDTTTTGSVETSSRASPKRRPVEIVAARGDRIWLRVDGEIRAAAPGDDVPLVGHIAAIVPRDGGWAVLDDKGATLLTIAKRANGASLFARQRIFE